MHRTSQKIFGVVAILVGVAIVVAIALGVTLPAILPGIIALVLFGASIYHYIVIRPAPTGVLPPEASPPHDDDDPDFLTTLGRHFWHTSVTTRPYVVISALSLRIENVVRGSRRWRCPIPQDREVSPE